MHSKPQSSTPRSTSAWARQNREKAPAPREAPDFTVLCAAVFAIFVGMALLVRSLDSYPGTKVSTALKPGAADCLPVEVASTSVALPLPANDDAPIYRLQSEALRARDRLIGVVERCATADCDLEAYKRLSLAYLLMRGKVISASARYGQAGINRALDQHSGTTDKIILESIARSVDDGRLSLPVLTKSDMDPIPVLAANVLVQTWGSRPKFCKQQVAAGARAQKDQPAGGKTLRAASAVAE